MIKINLKMFFKNSNEILWIILLVPILVHSNAIGSDKMAASGSDKMAANGMMVGSSEGLVFRNSSSDEYINSVLSTTTETGGVDDHDSAKGRIKSAKKKLYAPLVKHPSGDQMTTILYAKVDNSSNDIVTKSNEKEEKPPEVMTAKVKSYKSYEKHVTNNKDTPDISGSSVDPALNFDNLEDIRKNFKKGDLSDEDEQLLRDVNHERFDAKFIHPQVGNDFESKSSSSLSDNQQQSLLGLMSITEPPVVYAPRMTTLSPMDEYTVYIERHDIDRAMTEPGDDKIYVRDNTETNNTNQIRADPGTRHVYKIAKNQKTKVKGHDLLHKKDEQHHKYFDSQVTNTDRKFLEDTTSKLSSISNSDTNDINYSHTSVTKLTAIPSATARTPFKSSPAPGVSDTLLTSQETEAFAPLLNALTDVSLEKFEASDGSKDTYQILINLFNQFYWQSSHLRTKVSSPCGAELVTYLSALDRNEQWALKAFDASGHYRGQFLYGNDLWIGEKLFCEEINLTANKTEFEFGFFVARIALPTPFDGAAKIIQLGECLPKSCTVKDVRVMLELDQHLQLLVQEKNISKILSVRRTPGDYNLWQDRSFYIFAGVVLCVWCLIGVATVYEAQVNSEAVKSDDTKNGGCNGVESYEKKKDKKNKETLKAKEKDFELFQIRSSDNNNIDIEAVAQETTGDTGATKTQDTTQVHTKALPPKRKGLTDFPRKLLLCFGLNSNADAILSIEKTRDHSLACVHGIRVFSLLWTIMVHTYLQLFNIGENRFRRKVAERSFGYQIIGNATFSVDSFFFISGLLVTLVFLKQQKLKTNDTKEFVKKGLTHTIIVVIYRFIRLTPAYMFVIGFNHLSLKHVFEQTVFQPSVLDHMTCGKYWWRNILFINNWYPSQELCMIWSWYLANDMQFYVMAVVLLILSVRFFKASVITVIVFLTSSWITSGLFSLHYDYTHKVSHPFESFDFLYDKPWQRVGTYLVGIITGYVIYTVKTPPRVSFVTNMLLWASSLGLLFVLVFGVWEGELSVLGTAFYVSVGHTAWGLGLVWVTLSCCWGHANPVNRILSCRGFLPLSRLTYCTYLIHPVIMVITSFLMEGPIHLEHTMALTVFLGNAVLSFLFAFVISICFEAPVIRVLKLCFRK